MVRILIQPGMSLGGIQVLWWIKNPYLESQLPNGSKAHTVTDAPSGI